VVERVAKNVPELVGTVGRIEAKPGAINVIPGEVLFTIDVRAPVDDVRVEAVDELRSLISNIAQRRNLQLEIETLQQFRSSACAPWLMEQLERAIQAQGLPVRRLPSGAGHDGMAMKAIADIAMLFVRCKGGVSHNPAESITEEDAAIGAAVLFDFIHEFKPLSA
jgi:acetylornithine deacetylase/succinyl-diaminopimelate desuccinylase-like protein